MPGNPPSSDLNPFSYFEEDFVRFIILVKLMVSFFEHLDLLIDATDIATVVLDLTRILDHVFQPI